MNENKSKKSGLSFSSGIGSSSLLVIFVILCLVSFATLSIVSANADYKLSKKVLDRTCAYYTAEGQAQAALAALDAELAALCGQQFGDGVFSCRRRRAQLLLPSLRHAVSGSVRPHSVSQKNRRYLLQYLLVANRHYGRAGI